MSSAGRKEAFFSAVQQSLSANLEPPAWGVGWRGRVRGCSSGSNSGDPARLPPSSPSGQDLRMVVALQTPPLAGSSSPLPSAGPGPPVRRPPEPLGALPCWLAGRPRPRGSRRPLGTAPARRCAASPVSTPAVCCSWA